MHNAAFAACGLDAVYHALDVPPEGLGRALDGMRQLGLRQLAVSIPHKEAVMDHLDRVGDTARAIGAVNTVTRRGDELEGDNTDWLGALQALRREIEPKGRRAVVLGAGGAARAVVYGLIREGAEVTVLNRTESRAADLGRQLGAHATGRLEELGDLRPEIVVNTTSVGLRSDLSPVPAAALPETGGCVVMDAVYEPEQTRLLRESAERGAQPLGGKWMLVYQAAEQFRLWTDLDAPVQVMSQAFDDAGR